jgi:hypothetical protein
MSSCQLPTSYGRRDFLHRLLWLSGSALMTGCGAAVAGSSSAASIPQISTGTQTSPSGPVVQTSLVISGALSGSIGPAFTGLSYEKSTLCQPLFAPSNTSLRGVFQLLGPSILRIGGNSVDQCVWTPQGSGRTAGHISPSDVDSLAAFLQQTGWKCVYGINLGGVSTGATSPAVAAAEAAYVAQQLGSSLLGIEIGNECDGYGAPGSYFAGNWSLTQFESLWNTFRSAILQANPDIPVTGPASGSNVSTWTVPFGQFAAPNGLSLLTQHYYRGDGHSSSATAANLISSDANLTKCLSLLNSAARSLGTPFRMAECNSYFNGGAVGVSNSYASALWVIDFLFNCAQGGASGVNLHGGGHADGYAPIADDSKTVVEVRPEFYGMLLFALAGQGALYQTQFSVGQLNATAYAVKTAGGGVNLVIVNKESTQNLEVTAQLPQGIKTAKLMTMTQASSGASTPSLSATSGVTIQGGGVDPNGTFSPSAPYALAPLGSQVTCYVPALSAVLIQIN